LLLGEQGSEEFGQAGLPHLGHNVEGGFGGGAPQRVQEVGFEATGFVGVCGCCVGLELLFLLDRKTINSTIATGTATITIKRNIRMISPPPKLPRNAKCKKEFIFEVL
jgi:hypothetical protein